MKIADGEAKMKPPQSFLVVIKLMRELADCVIFRTNGKVKKKNH
jgi:hypothetical protein